MCKKVLLKIAGGNKHSDEKMSLKNVSFLAEQKNNTQIGNWDFTLGCMYYMELNLIREQSYDRGALADSFTALRIEPTTYGLKVTCSKHCATCSYSLDI